MVGCYRLALRRATANRFSRVAHASIRVVAFADESNRAQLLCSHGTVSRLPCPRTICMCSHSGGILDSEPVAVAMKSSARPDRKTIERNRRIHMKALYSELIALLPSPSSKKEAAAAAAAAGLTLLEMLDEAIKYIKEKQGRLENMRKRKRQLSAEIGRQEAAGSSECLPKIEVQKLRTNLNSGLKVVIMSSPWEHQEVFWEAIRVLEVEGFEVAAASYAVTGDKAFHIVQSLATEFRTGVEAGRVLEKLQKAIVDV